MSPRARRSESITLPPGNQPGLIRYNDDIVSTTEKLLNTEGSGENAGKDSPWGGDDRYDTQDTNYAMAVSDSESDFDSSSRAADKVEDCGR